MPALSAIVLDVDTGSYLFILILIWCNDSFVKITQYDNDILKYNVNK